VRFPEVPPGFQQVSRGRLREARIRALIGDCRGKYEAHGWGGDAYVVAKKEPELLLQWVTVWDSPAAAERFADVMARMRSCALWPPDRLSSWSTGTTIFRRGTTVVVVRSTGQARPVPEELLALAGTPPPPQPPLGPLEPLGPLNPSRERVDVENGVWTSPFYGFSAAVPDEFTVDEWPFDGAILELTHDGVRRARRSLAFLPQPYDAKDDGRAFDDLIARRDPNDWARPSRKDTVRRRTVAGVSGWELLSVERGIAYNVVVWPACGGRKTLAVFVSSPEGEPKEDVERWIGSLQITDADPPACEAALSPRR